jgi:hypothetical protein
MSNSVSRQDEIKSYFCSNAVGGIVYPYHTQQPHGARHYSQFHHPHQTELQAFDTIG